MSNSLVPDQSRCFVGHDLDPKCLKRTSGTFHLIILLIDALTVHRSLNRRVPNGSASDQAQRISGGPYMGSKCLKIISDMPRSDLICVQNV